MSGPQLARIGSMLFINRGDTPDQIAAWVEQMAASGLRLLRLFVYWDLVEPQPSNWDFSQFDTVFDVAAKHGIGVVPTIMAETAPGWMQRTNNNQEVADLDDPAHWSRALGYVRKVVQRYADHKALDSWIAWNEASIEPRQTAGALRELQRFLRSRYRGDIENLNRAWYPQFGDFDQIGWRHVAAQQGGPVPAFAAALDYYRFSVEYLHSKLGDICAVVREHDNLHPIHLNPHNLAGPVFKQGQSVWRSGELFDFLGCSAHPVWHATRFGRARFDEAIAFFTAMVRDASRDRRCWVSELQGGSALMSGGVSHTPTRRHIRRWLWTSIGSGAEAVVYWCFNTRHDGGEAGEWGLLDWQGQPSVRLKETEKVVEALNRHRKVFAGARPGDARVGILVSEASQMHAAQGKGSASITDPRTPWAGVDAVAGACAVCRALGLPYQLFDESRLQEGLMDGIEELIVPGAWCLETSSAKALASFVRRGGSIIADGLPGWKDDTGRVDGKGMTVIGEMLGAQVNDVECDTEGVTLRGDDGDLPGWWLRVLLDPAEDAEVTHRDSDGRPLAVNRPGTEERGRTVWFGTCAFQRYFAYREQEWLSRFAEALGSALREPVALSEPSHEVIVHRLEGEDLPFYLIQNLSGARMVGVELERPAKVCPVESDQWRRLEAGSHNIDLGADRVILMVPDPV